MEFLATIPGTIGGLVFMNAGAYGQEIKDIVQEVTFLYELGNLITKNISELNMQYRSSIFKEKKTIITQVMLKLNKLSNNLLPLEKIKTYKQLRKNTQPINNYTAGSTFENPKGMKAWELIENMGFKGYQINGAMVSYKHANFLINYHNARYIDMIKLIKEIQEKAKNDYDISLVCEWVIVK